MNEGNLPEVKTAQISYLDYLCQVWDVRRGPRAPERLDPRENTTDIYATRREDELANRFARHRVRWPY